MTKLRIAWDIDKTWDYQAFRDVIKQFLIESDKYELYLITKFTDATFVDINVVALGMNEDNVFQGLLTDDDVLESLNDNKIDIYLTPFEQMRVRTNIESVDTTGVLVNEIQDIYAMQPKWLVQLNFWIKRLKEINESKAC